MRLFKDPKINFMDSRARGFIFSGVLILASLISLVLHGGPKFGIDFRGGTFMELRFVDAQNPEAELNIPIDEVRSVFQQQDLHGTEIKYYGSTQDISAQIDSDNGLPKEEVQALYTALGEAFPGYQVVERRIETVGPKIGQELVYDAVWAILFSMGLILVYIMFRFEFRFGVGAVMALFHDVIITLGVFSLLDIEISIPVIAAVLTIIGYSLNDTIVVFDRIRENMKSFSRKIADFSGMVNRSINETLSRTVVTSTTTLMVVIILYFFGGEIIRDFALALICGVIIGTYSSIFVASPILVEWDARRKGAVAVKK